jgi:hypothetical protein
MAKPNRTLKRSRARKFLMNATSNNAKICVMSARANDRLLPIFAIRWANRKVETRTTPKMAKRIPIVETERPRLEA